MIIIIRDNLYSFIMFQGPFRSTGTGLRYFSKSYTETLWEATSSSGSSVCLSRTLMSMRNLRLGECSVIQWVCLPDSAWSSHTFHSEEWTCQQSLHSKWYVLIIRSVKILEVWLPWTFTFTPWLNMITSNWFVFPGGIPSLANLDRTRQDTVGS